MKKLALIFISAIVLITIGCKKDKKDPIDNQTISSQDNGTAENLFADIKRVVEEVANDEGNSAKPTGGNKSGYSFGTCATVTVNPAWIDTTWPKTVTIDFGTTNCTGSYGINRRGILTFTLTGRYIDSGTVLTVQPQNYYVNDYKIEGTKTLTNNGRNANNNLSYSVYVNNAKITYPDGSYANWTSNRVNEWIEGDTTNLFTHGLAGLCDDVYSIVGTGSGVNRNGLSYTVNITSALRKEICCRWLVSGVVVIVPTGLPSRTVDFGNGTCDNIATVTINGNTFTVPMF